MEKTIFMKNIKIFYAWLNYWIGFYTINGRKAYQIDQLYTEYMEAKYLNK